MFDIFKSHTVRKEVRSINNKTKRLQKNVKGKIKRFKRSPYMPLFRDLIVGLVLFSFGIVLRRGKYPRFTWAPLIILGMLVPFPQINQFVSFTSLFAICFTAFLNAVQALSHSLHPVLGTPKLNF